MAQRKSVSFYPEIQVQMFEPSQEEVNSDWIHQSSRRLRLEKLVHDHPTNEKERFEQLIELWRNHPISVGFGNLGRQPHLLDYFLDLCFHSDEKVKLVSHWPSGSPYQIQKGDPQPLDFLFVLEPYFGYTVQKPSNVEHLIVLTSHLHLVFPTPAKLYMLHLSSFTNIESPLSELPQRFKKLKPPIFHDAPFTSKESAVMLDVTRSKTAHEAYLRVLTGKEMVKHLPYKVEMTKRDQDILNRCLRVSKRHTQLYWPDTQWIGKVYWDEFL